MRWTSQQYRPVSEVDRSAAATITAIYLFTARDRGLLSEAAVSLGYSGPFCGIYKITNNTADVVALKLNGLSLDCHHPRATIPGGRFVMPTSCEI